MGRRRIPVITKKVLTTIIVAGTLLCFAIGFLGYSSFNRQFRVQYDSNIRSIAAAAREALNSDSFETYLATGEKDETWTEIHKILQDFVDKFDLNLLYVSSVKGENYTDITYIFNPVKKDGKWSEFPFLYNESYIEPNYNSSAKRVFENGETIVRHTLKTRSGSHITAMVPVFDSKGKIVAVLGAQKSIQEFVDAGQSYIKLVFFVGLLFALIFFFLFAAGFSLSFIKPLILITKETDHFASYGDKPSVC